MSDTLLTIEHLAKSFGENTIHRDINLKLKKHEMLGLLGNSGTGKSVLLRSIIGLERIDSGKIYYQDKRIDNLVEDELFPVRTKISYAFQNGALFDSINIFENIAYPLFEHTKLTFTEITAKVENMLALVGLEGKTTLMPSDLSGGMRKRVGLARSIILNPDVVLYDEPTAGLDPVNTENILNIMQKMKETGTAGIFVTHDIPAAVKVCDRIVIIDKGIIAYEGTPDDLMSSDNEIVNRFFKDHNDEYAKGKA
ncbi:MAG: ATP-binding cassette domain-containing protein [Bacteriovoracaceae bacterium]|nr:ATP-binding cassette domain-containing protein [Bacteriovoracaceae bacterium]